LLGDIEKPGMQWHYTIWSRNDIGGSEPVCRGLLAQVRFLRIAENIKAAIMKIWIGGPRGSLQANTKLHCALDTAHRLTAHHFDHLRVCLAIRVEEGSLMK
jgi:hypothetical protein